MYCHHDRQTRIRQQGYGIRHIWLSCEFHHRTLSGSILPTPDIARNFRSRFSHMGLPNSTPIDDGRVNAPVVLSANPSRRASSRAGYLNQTCVLVIFGGPGGMLSYEGDKLTLILFETLPSLKIKFIALKLICHIPSHNFDLSQPAISLLLNFGPLSVCIIILQPHFWKPASDVCSAQKLKDSHSAVSIFKEIFN
jgi:hypothetical protein